MKKRYEKMTNAQLGADFEGKLRTAFLALKQESKHGLMSVRFYDSKSAGSLIPPQPSDFLIGCQQGAFLLEAKASFKKQSLASCLSNAVSGHQAASAKLWCRSGPNQKSLFVFFCAETEQVELWDGLLVANAFITPGARLKKGSCPLTGDAKELKNLLRRALL